MSIKKTYFKTKSTCKINFRLPKEVVNEAESVNLVGEFNGWDEAATPLRKLKNGSFTGMVELERDKEYQFRYLIDHQRWENDTHADKLAPTPFGDAQNFVVIT